MKHGILLVTAIALQFPVAIESKNIKAKANIHILPTIYIIYKVTINYPLTWRGVTSAINIDDIGKAIPNNNPNKNLNIINYGKSYTNAVRSIAMNNITIF